MYEQQNITNCISLINFSADSSPKIISIILQIQANELQKLNHIFIGCCTTECPLFRYQKQNFHSLETL